MRIYIYERESGRTASGSILPYIHTYIMDAARTQFVPVQCPQFSSSFASLHIQTIIAAILGPVLAAQEFASLLATVAETIAAAWAAFTGPPKM